MLQPYIESTAALSVLMMIKFEFSVYFQHLDGLKIVAKDFKCTVLHWVLVECIRFSQEKKG